MNTKDYNAWKVRVKSEVMARDLWDEFVSAREAAQLAGYAPGDSWNRAAVAVLGPDFAYGGNVPAPKAATGPGGESTGEIAGVRPLTSQAVAMLHSKASGRQAKEKNYVRWVGQNLSKPETMIDYEGVPCDEAVGMLVWVRLHPGNVGEFYRGVWPKVIVKGDLEKGSEQQDDMADLVECEKALESMTQ